MQIEIKLSPEKEGDESKIVIDLNEEGSDVLKIYDCDSSTRHVIRKGDIGKFKLLRIKTAIDILLNNQ